MAGSEAPRVSALVYFGGVAAATALGLAVAMLLRPAFAHTVLQLSGLERIPRASANSFYTVRVAPLLQTHCASCHGAEREKGGLRLDSLAGTLRGGKHGAVIAAGDAKNSELMARILLPATDDKAMPPGGKAPLNRDDVTVIRLWIAAGASGTLPVGAIKDAPRLVAPVTMPEIDPAKVRKLRAPLADQVAQLQSRFPGVIQYDSRSSADLVVDASLKRGAFGDADLRALAPLQDRIVEVNLSGTAVTDASAAALAAMPSLRRLRLTDTRATDASIQALAASKTLKVLAVTKAGPDVLAPLRRRGVRIYEASDGP
jgi:mono/diheme cytochrome c family protein